MFQITIFFLYLLAAVTFGMSRLPQHAGRERLIAVVAILAGAVGVVLHGFIFYRLVVASTGLNLSIASAVSLIALQLALIGVVGGVEQSLRGMAAGLIGLAALGSLAIGVQSEPGGEALMIWQLKGHILISMFAYGLLTAGAIVAVYALLLDRRLRSGRFVTGNPLFAPLETTEKMLYAITAAGFTGLLLAVVTGFTFVENLFAQHLVHKTVLSLLALLLFGVLLAGRMVAGWRGRRAVSLYLWGFGFLCLAYFGSRFILEEILGRSWG